MIAAKESILNIQTKFYLSSILNAPDILGEMKKYFGLEGKSSHLLIASLRYTNEISALFGEKDFATVEEMEN